MAAKKPKSNLASSVDDILGATPSIRPAQQEAARPRRSAAAESEHTVLVGANLPETYARNLAMLHAETGRSKKELLRQALDMLFVSKGGPGLKAG